MGDRFIVPPLKIQGRKHKLLEFLLAHFPKNIEGRWIEPFLGSGIVVFNARPKRAILGDKNPYIIEFYQKIYKKDINLSEMKEYLIEEGKKIKEHGADYYYEVRDRFNKQKNIFDFLVINRASFSGVIRFNAMGEFNTAYSYYNRALEEDKVNKIVDKIKMIMKVMEDKEWEFYVGDWTKVMHLDISNSDFIYMDPPYNNKHGYYEAWDDKNTKTVLDFAIEAPCKVAISSWYQHGDTINKVLEEYHDKLNFYYAYHKYHVGAIAGRRNKKVIEVLIANYKNAFFSDLFL